MNPNSQNQLWSKWTFDVREAGRHVPRKTVEYNAAKWMRLGFGTAGQVRVHTTLRGWRIEALVEGRPAHDPAYVASVRLGWREFVEKGWGALATGRVRVKVMAGSQQDGRPAAQMVMMPCIWPD